MKQLSSALTLLTTTGIGMVMSSPAMAQTGASASDFTADIVVTARRVEERLQDVPISITVFSQEQISDRNITSSTDLATYTPSLVVNPNFGPDKASFAIRGFNSDLATSPTVAVYFADVVAPRGISQTLAGNGVGAGGLMDMQNVQVLKGPQGTLFGRNTTGGAILLVPQKPKDNFGGYLEGTYGSYNQRRLQGVLNLPLADTFKIRLAGDWNKRDGYLRNRSGVGPKDMQNINYYSFRLSVLANLTDNIENYTVASYSRSSNTGGQPQILFCQPPPNAGIAAVFAPLCRGMIERRVAGNYGKFDVESNNPFPLTRLKTWQVLNTTTWDVSDNLTIKNITSYAELRETTRTTIFGENFIFPSTSPFAGKSLIFVIAASFPGGDTASQSTFTEELQFQGRSDDGNLTWQVGGYIERSNPLGDSIQRIPNLMSCNNYLTLDCTPVGLPASFNSTALRTTVKNNGIYAQSTYKFGKFDLTAGIRYTKDKTIGKGRSVFFDLTAPFTVTQRCQAGLLFPSPTVPGRGKTVTDRAECQQRSVAKSSKPTWLINLGYNFTDDMMTYAKYSRGYRQGFVNLSAPGFETWEPDKLDAYEIGFKASFRGTISGYLNFAAFYNDLSNQQVQATGVPRVGSGLAGVTTIINAGKSRLQGIEVDSSLALGQSIRLEFGYALLDTKLKSLSVPPIDPLLPYDSLLPVVQAGGRLTFVPKHRVTTTATYNLPTPDEWGKMSVGVTYTYTSNVLHNANATLVGVAPATNLFNLNFNWKSIGGRPIDLAAFCTNCTNVRVQTNLTGLFVSTGFEGKRIGEARMYGVRLRYRFGE